MQEKRSSSLSVKETGRDWGNISDHRTHHTPLRNTWKPGGPRGLKMKQIWVEMVKNRTKYLEKGLNRPFGSKRPRVRIPALRPSVSLYGTHRFFIYIFHLRIVIIIVAWKCAAFCDLGLIRYNKGPVDTTTTPTEHIIHYTLQAKSCAKGQAPLEPPDNKAGWIPRTFPVLDTQPLFVVSSPFHGLFSPFVKFDVLSFMGDLKGKVQWWFSSVTQI